MSYFYDDSPVWKHEYKGTTYCFRITDGCSKLNYNGKKYDFVVPVWDENNESKTFTVPFSIPLDDINHAPVSMTRKGIEEYVDRKQNG